MTRLHAEVVRADGAKPERWAFVLHGIFGSGKNWLSFARKLASARPEWGFVLPDLRGHGRSQGFAAPHRLDAVAADLAQLEAALGLGAIDVAIGHSFGGKVALVYGSAKPLRQAWVLDSNPGIRYEASQSQTVRVLEMLEGMHERFATRAEFTRAVEQHGFSSAIAAWLSMSVRPSEGGYEIGLDLPMIRALLDDFFRVDVWSELARMDRTTHLVVAGKSFVWDAEDRQTIERLSASNTMLEVHTFPEAGHWVHVDAHDEMFALLASRL
jgi:esterase